MSEKSCFQSLGVPEKNPVKWQVPNFSTDPKVPNKTKYLMRSLIHFQDILHQRQESIVDLLFESENRIHHLTATNLNSTKRH
jgi:hypothetical protein